MSGTSLTTLLKSPKQAFDIYSQAGSYPKQRHVFMVEFHIGHQVNDSHIANLTFVVKSCDRPSIQPHFEELNQYNKKRHIYTGYKTTPVKLSFYDSADGAALRLWNDYSKYYFGDFNQPASVYMDDTYGALSDNAKGFGFNAVNGNNPGNNSQFYFTSINIYHFYSQTYDLITLVNPKITSFDPHDLSYDSADVALIDMQLVYDAVLTTIAAGSPSGLPEFSGKFNGETVDPSGVPGTNGSPFSSPALSSSQNGLGLVESMFGINSNSSIGTRLSSLVSSFAPALSASALSSFGNFNFGTGTIGTTQYGATLGASLASYAVSNQALANYLGLSSGPQYSMGAGSGVNNAFFASVSSQMASAAGGNTVAANTLTSGVMGAQTITGTSGATITGNGVILSSDALSAINAARSGTSQYGLNTVSGSTSPPATPFSPSQPTTTINPVTDNFQVPTIAPPFDTDSFQTSAQIDTSAPGWNAVADPSTGQIPDSTMSVDEGTT